MRPSRWLSMLLALVVCEALHAQGWWDTRWKRRRAVTVKRRRAGFSDWALARFILNSECAPDGRDIRVIDETGLETPSQVIWARSNGFCEVAFKTRPRVQRYYVYWGNSAAAAPRYEEKPKVGLVMETRERPRGGCNSWADYRRLLAGSRIVYGRTVVGNIFHGFNPFGPSESYMTVYRGWLYAPSNGVYRIATNSDDSSFVFVDGKMVVQWPGGHGPTAAYGEHNAKVELKRGLHRIEYYHETSGGGQACVLGWWKPGDKIVSLVGHEYFPGFLETTVGRLQERGKRIVAEMKAKPVSEAKLYGGHLLIEVRFTGIANGASNKASFHWDFGDGLTSGEKNPSHIFLTPGVYTVTLTVTEGGHKSVARLRHYMGFLFFHREPADKNRRYARLLRSYDFARVKTTGLLAALTFADLCEDDDLRLAVLRVLIGRKDDLSEQRYLSALRDAGRLLIEHAPAAATARVCFERMLKTTKKPWWTAQGELGLADVKFILERKLDEALKTYRDMVERYRERSPGYAKTAQIRTGDVLRAQGKYRQAMEAYVAAKKMSALYHQQDERTRRGRLVLEAYNYTERRLYKEALKRLEDWEWQIPEDKLTSEYSIMRARVLFRLGRKKAAEHELADFVAVNSSKDCPSPSNHLPEALYALAVVRADRGDADGAESLLERLLREHPDAEETLKKARKLLERLGG